MSWLQKLLPPKIKREAGGPKKAVPEGLWSKCESCEAVLYRADLEKNAYVCPKCSHHNRISARERLDYLLDVEGRYEIGAEVLPVDTLKFKDSRRYTERLQEARNETSEEDALVVMQGSIKALPVVAAAFEFGFLGGSMGSVVGERFVRGVQVCLEQRLPFVCFTASGGARMQEGVLSLMQMAKTCAALTQLAKERLPFISVLTDPTMGGVSASFAMHRRCRHRRAGRAHRLRRAARHRADGARNAAGRLPARRVPARAWRDRHDRGPPAPARQARALSHPPAQAAADCLIARARTRGRCLERCHAYAAAHDAGGMAGVHRARPSSLDRRWGSTACGPSRRRWGSRPRFPIVTVGGTNGKGSACAMLEAILSHAGYRVGSYTSPHLIRYNERVRIDRREASDEALVRAFGAIEAARGDVPLTYFEFGTLAAVSLFIDASVDVGVLEVGLGGRLDAVNAFDADCALVMSVDLDHLGLSRRYAREDRFRESGHLPCRPARHMRRSGPAESGPGACRTTSVRNCF